MPTHAPQDGDDLRIASLYEASAGLTPWPDALGRVHDAMAVDALQLVVIDKRDGSLVTSEQPSAKFTPPVVDGILEHVRYYHRLDPHIPRVAASPIGTLFHSRRDIPDREIVENAFYRDYWAAYAARSLLAAKVGENAQQIAMLGVTRLLHRPEFADDDHEQFRRYVDHLSTAMRIAQHLTSAMAIGEAGSALLKASPRAFCVLDFDGRVDFINDRMSALVDRGDVLSLEQGHLRFVDDAAHRNFSRAIASLVGESADANATRRTGLRVRASNGMNLYCTLWRVVSQLSMGLFGSYPVMVLSIADGFDAVADDHPFLAAMFDLTPAEARLASAVARGESIGKFAESHLLSVETVRSHLKHLFEKTGVHRQAELARLVADMLRPA